MATHTLGFLLSLDVFILVYVCIVLPLRTCLTLCVFYILSGCKAHFLSGRIKLRGDSVSDSECRLLLSHI